MSTQEMIVEIWPKGYADDLGLKSVRMLSGSDYATEARKLFGISAAVYNVRPLHPMVKQVSAETAAYYTKGDNT